MNEQEKLQMIEKNAQNEKFDRNWFGKLANRGNFLSTIATNTSSYSTNPVPGPKSCPTPGESAELARIGRSN